MNERVLGNLDSLHADRVRRENRKPPLTKQELDEAAERGVQAVEDWHGGPPKAEEPEWIFTFGMGQEHDGVSYAHKFVRIRGTFENARQEMFKRYGRKWSMQYGSEDEAGVHDFNLEEVK